MTYLVNDWFLKPSTENLLQVCFVKVANTDAACKSLLLHVDHLLPDLFQTPFTAHMLNGNMDEKEIEEHLLAYAEKD